MEKRVQKELSNLSAESADATAGIQIEPVGDNLSHLLGTIRGPDGTPYAGGTFQVDLELSIHYPFAPPKMKFLTKVYHPNISSQTGAICLNILKNEWSPALSLKTALLSLQALLSSPEPDDPQDAVVASVFKKDHNEFVRTAKYWTETYAKPAEAQSEKIKQLTDMGFDATKARVVLNEHKGDVAAALEALLSL